MITYIRVVEGTITARDENENDGTGKEFEVVEVGTFTPHAVKVDELTVGDVGFMSRSIKSVGDTRVGDTITEADRPGGEPLPGYRKINPMVFCGLYPVDSGDYNDLTGSAWRNYS